MAATLIANVGKSSSGTSGAIDTTGATCLLAVVGALGDVNPFSDSKSNRWLQIPYTPNNASVHVFVALGPLTVGSGHTFTIGGSNLPSFCVAAFSGVYLMDLSQYTRATAIANAVQAGSLTPGYNSSVVIAGLCLRDTGTTPTIDGGFTITDSFTRTAGVADGSALAYLIQTTAAAANPTWSFTEAAENESAILLAFPAIPLGGTGTGGSYAFAG